MIYLIFWGVIFVVTVLAELATLQLISIWFSFGAVGAFFAAFRGLGFAGQLAIFVLVSFALLLLTRPLLRAIRVKQTPPMNAEKSIGQTAVVIEPIDPARDTGRVRSKGVDWHAVSETGEPIPSDAIVIVTKVDGAKLFVRPAEQYSALPSAK